MFRKRLDGRRPSALFIHRRDQPKPFFLLRLPRNIIIEILKRLSTHEKFNVMKASREAANAIRAFTWADVNRIETRVKLCYNLQQVSTFRYLPDCVRTLNLTVLEPSLVTSKSYRNMASYHPPEFYNDDIGRVASQNCLPLVIMKTLRKLPNLQSLSLDIETWYPDTTGADYAIYQNTKLSDLAYLSIHIKESDSFPEAWFLGLCSRQSLRVLVLYRGLTNAAFSTAREKHRGLCSLRVFLSASDAITVYGIGNTRTPRVLPLSIQMWSCIGSAWRSLVSVALFQPEDGMPSLWKWSALERQWFEKQVKKLARFLNDEKSFPQLRQIAIGLRKNDVRRELQETHDVQPYPSDNDFRDWAFRMLHRFNVECPRLEMICIAIDCDIMNVGLTRERELHCFQVNLCMEHALLPFPFDTEQDPRRAFARMEEILDAKPVNEVHVYREQVVDE